MNLTKQEILFQTKKKLFLNFHGEHTSIFSGNGIDFKEIRQYTTNDDIRHINWKNTAKTKQPSVNIYNETKQLNIVLLYLNSGGLDFGDKKSKKDIATEVITALSFATISNNDMLTTIFYDESNIKFFKPTKHKSIVDINYDVATNIKSLGKTIDYNHLNWYILNKLKKKSLIFIIGDFLDFKDFSQISEKHEIYCIVIRDKKEENLNLLGQYNIIDTNTLKEYDINIDRKSITNYNKQMKNYDNKLFSHFKKYKINYQKIYTNDNSIEKLKILVKGY